MEAASRPPALPKWAKIVGIISLALIALSMVCISGEMRYRNCLEEAQAKYPATPVSAFDTKSTGPIKLSFVQERQKAVEDCGWL